MSHSQPAIRRRPAANPPGIVTAPICLALWLVLCMPVAAQVNWTVDPAGQPGTVGPVASTTNESGYRLEIYRDGNDIRSRFTLNEGLYGMHACPTYQVDEGMPRNQSIDGSVCRAGDGWAEFILGQVDDGHVVSPLLLALMDGNTLHFRFRLMSGDYRETNISLRGSKRSMTTVIGEEVIVRAR